MRYLLSMFIILFILVGVAYGRNRVTHDSVYNGSSCYSGSGNVVIKVKPFSSKSNKKGYYPRADKSKIFDFSPEGLNKWNKEMEKKREHDPGFQYLKKHGLIVGY